MSSQDETALGAHSLPGHGTTGSTSSSRRTGPCSSCCTPLHHREHDRPSVIKYTMLGLFMLFQTEAGTMNNTVLRWERRADRCSHALHSMTAYSIE